VIVGFLVGVFLSTIAAAPAWMLLWGGREAEFKQRLKLWGIGTGIRFAIIGAGLVLLFRNTQIDRIPPVIGVAAAYLAIYVLEVKKTLRP
jgi:hypothetical protein